MSTAQRVSGVVALAASALIGIGAAADWTGVAYSSGVDRWIAAGAALLAAVIGIVVLAGRPRLAAAALLPAAVALDMAIVNLQDVSGHQYEFAAYPRARPGVGLYLVLGGGLVAGAVAIATLAAMARRRLGSGSR